MFIVRYGQRTRRAVARLRAWVPLTPWGFVLILAGIAAVAGSLLVVGGVSEDVIAHDGVYRSDPAHLMWFVAHRDLFEIDVSTVLALVGGVGVLLVLAALAGLFFVVRRVPLALAAAPAVSLLAAGAAAGIVKTIVNRGRPAGAWRLGPVSGASFPSGHTADTTAFILALALVVAIVVLRRTLARVCVVAAAAIASLVMGASRLILAVHWPTDVVAGGALGAAVAFATVLVAVVATRMTPPTAARRARLVVRLVGWSRSPAPS
jgi:undecaprenyl-diphosphatase